MKTVYKIELTKEFMSFMMSKHTKFQLSDAAVRRQKKLFSIELI